MDEPADNQYLAEPLPDNYWSELARLGSLPMTKESFERDMALVFGLPAPKHEPEPKGGNNEQIDG